MTDNTRFFYGYVIVIMSFLAMMLLLGLHSVFGIFFKPIIEELEWTRTVTSGAFSLSQVMFGLLGIVMGRLNDRFGPRVVMTLCGLLAGLGYLLMSQIQSIWQMYLLYGVMIGVGSSIYVPLLSTVARWFVQRRSMMTGIVFAGAGVGILILPLAINQLINTYNWRVSFIILGVIILLVIVLTAQFLRRDPGQVAYSMNNSTKEDLKLETRGFSLREAASTKQFWMFLAALTCYGFCFFSIQVHIAPYITDIGISATTAAAILATIGGATIIGQIGLGSAGDKLGYKRTFLAGIIMIIIAVVILMVTKELWAFFLFAVFWGLAFGGCSTVESPMVAWLFGLASHGLILGFFSFSFTVGAAIGPLIFGYIYDVNGNYQVAFLVCGICAILAFILTMFVKSTAVESTVKVVNTKE